MNSTDERKKDAAVPAIDASESLKVALWKVENQISKLTDKYLATEMPAKTFMQRQTPLLLQRSVLVAKIKVLSNARPSYVNTTKVSEEAAATVDAKNDSQPDNSPN